MAAHTKSTTPSDKHFWPNAWAKPASSPKQVQANTASQQPSHVPHLGLKGIVYMGTEDCERQRLNVYRMRLLNTEVYPVDSGSKTLKDSINEAFRDWVTNLESTYYLIGSTMGPHPYPMMVRDFQSVIGKEIKQQFKAENRRLTGCTRRLRRRRKQRHGHLLPLRRRHRRETLRRRSGRRRHRIRQTLAPPSRLAQKASSTACTPTSCRTRMGKSQKPTASQQA